MTYPGIAIRTRRKELHYTQAYLSELTGFSTSFNQTLGMDMLIEKRG